MGRGVPRAGVGGVQGWKRGCFLWSLGGTVGNRDTEPVRGNKRYFLRLSKISFLLPKSMYSRAAPWVKGYYNGKKDSIKMLTLSTNFCGLLTTSCLSRDCVPFSVNKIVKICNYLYQGCGVFQEKLKGTPYYQNARFGKLQIFLVFCSLYLSENWY